MTCEIYQSWLATYIDAEVDGLDVATLYPDVQHHLELCFNCAQIYLDILKLALVEEAGELPTPDLFPAPDLSFLKFTRPM